MILLLFSLSVLISLHQGYYLVKLHTLFPIGCVKVGYVLQGIHPYVDVCVCIVDIKIFPNL